MTNFQLLMQLNNLVNELQKFYSSVNLQHISKYDRLDLINNLKPEIAKISAINEKYYPVHIFILKHRLVAVLPWKNNPLRYYFERKLNTLMDECKKLTAETTKVL